MSKSKIFEEINKGFPKNNYIINTESPDKSYISYIKISKKYNYKIFHYINTSGIECCSEKLYLYIYPDEYRE